ncbi:MAG: serine/threonine protein phosphatase, partial [Mycobacterium sp.]
PAGNLDEAIGQLRELAHGSLLPVCAPPKPARVAPPAAPRTGSGGPAAPPPAPSPTPAPKPGLDCRAAA